MYLNFIKKYWQFLLAGVAIVLLICIAYIMSFSSKNTDDSVLTNITLESSSPASSESVKHKSSSIIVDIKGAVKKPGIYKISNELRVNDVVNLAGGLCENAEIKGINLAQKIADEMVIYVPFIGEKIENDITTNTKNDDKININTATQEELQKISGIGQKKSEDIVNYREANGGFKSIDELKNVSGIGAATIEKIREYVTI